MYPPYTNARVGPLVYSRHTAKNAIWDDVVVALGNTSRRIVSLWENRCARVYMSIFIRISSFIQSAVALSTSC